MKSIDIPNGVVGALKDSLDDILGIRDELGAAMMPVYMVVRAWSGEENGEGDATETKSQVLPSPRIVALDDASKIQPGGAVQLGDLFLTQISKKSYPLPAQVDASSTDQGIERFYEIGGELYTVIKVIEKHLTWSVQVRKLSNQNRHT